MGVNRYLHFALACYKLELRIAVERRKTMPRETKKQEEVDDLTITSRASLPDLPVDDPSRPATISRSTMNAPWLLQQHFAGKVDLPSELSNR